MITFYTTVGTAMAKAAFDAHALAAAVAPSKNDSDVAMFDTAIERFEDAFGPCRSATLARIKKTSQKSSSRA